MHRRCTLQLGDTMSALGDIMFCSEDVISAMGVFNNNTDKKLKYQKFYENQVTVL